MAKTPENATAADPAEQARMSFGEHLEELRKRIFRAFFGSIFAIVVCFLYVKDIVRVVVRPYRLAALAHHLPDLFTSMKPQEVFLSYLTLAFQAGLIISSPWIIYQLWQFVAAGLFPRERKIVYRYIGPSALLFLLGVAFFYFIVLPTTLSFFITFTNDTAGPAPTPNWFEKMMGLDPSRGAPEATTRPTALPTTTTAPATPGATQPGLAQGTIIGPDGAEIPVLEEDPPAPRDGRALIYVHRGEGRVKVRYGDLIFTMPVALEGSLFLNNWRFDDYLSFVAFTALLFGIAFEMPMVITVLAQTGIVETKTFRSIRKYAYFGIVVAAAFAAPSGDPMTLVFFVVPLVGLYEMGIVAASIVVGRQKKAAAGN